MLEDFEAFVRAGVERGVIDAEKGQALLRAWQERSAGPQEQARELVTGGFIDTSCLVELGDEIAFPYRQTLKVTLRECERPKEPARVLLPEGLPAEVEAVAAADRARHFVEREGKPPRFYLVQKAGQGGMGVVWKAWEVELHRWVAVKILTGKSEDDRKRFKREAQMAAGLQHANIVPVYEVGDWNGILFINMAYLPGRTLADARGTLKLEERVRCVMDAARAVQFAHEHGVLHRDLKPSNILLGERGAVYVCDFGLAKRMEPGTSLTMEGFVVGTPAYMPPEAATLAGPKGDPRSDVYSLGAVLYEMLTGRPPYKGADAMKVLLEVVSKEPKAPRKVDSRIPVELEVVCQKAMERHPWARYGSAGALADELGRWLRGEGIMARPTGRVVRLGRWVKARRVILGTAVGVAVVVAAGWMVRARVVAAGYVREARGAWGRYEDGAGRLRAIHEAMVGQEFGSEAYVKSEVALGREEAAVRQAYAEGVDWCRRALAEMPGDGEARGLLERFVWERFTLAETCEDPQVEEYKASVRAWAGERYGAELDKRVRVTVETNVPGARVRYHLYVEGEDGRLQMGVAEELAGVTPLQAEIPQGSGVLILTKEGYASRRDSARDETVVPVFARRGEEVLIDVNLYERERIPAGFVLVPRGYFIMGGDPHAVDSHPRERKFVEDFFISVHEVTWGEYGEFLRAMWEREPGEVEKNEPRDYDQRRRILEKGPSGFVIPEEARERPVSYVTWEQANAYCSWRCEEGNFKFALPTSSQWEKAARGVDGRPYPWGWRFSWGFTHGRLWERATTLLEITCPVGVETEDESPYGTRFMAGNVAEWSCDLFGGTQKALESRGGRAFSYNASDLRCGSRFSIPPDRHNPTLGFRPVAIPGM